MDTDASLEKGKHQGYRGQLLVVLRQRTDCIGIDLLDTLLLRVLIEVASLQGSRILLAVSLREGEDNAGIEFLVHD